MIEREVAWRVFAYEFNSSNYFFHEGDERSPNYLVTPTGAMINRLYIVGVFTEVDNLQSEEEMFKARISDPTGAFTIYAGQYQPEAAILLSGLDIPSFASVTGKARTYEPEKGKIYTSVRPEELYITNSNIRDKWILDTAHLSFERIQLVRRALHSTMNDEDLKAMLIQYGASVELADGITRAIKYYSDLDKYLDELITVIINALKTLLPEDFHPDIEKKTSKNEGSDTDRIIYELMKQLDKGKGVQLAQLVDESGHIGITEEQVHESVKNLMSEGKCYEPRIDILRRV
ncbi:MAG: DNA-binding protein [Methanosarcinales archaeon]|nr:DNA-binding protein [Methanosarcinales archaeon]